MKTIVADINNLKDVAKAVKESGFYIFLLRGDLASGKTTLVKEFVKLLGNSQEATSPTFLIEQNYGNLVYHYDIYNAGSEKFLSLGLFEEFEKEGYHFIEWADERIESMLKEYEYEYCEIKIKKIENAREYSFRCIN